VNLDLFIQDRRPSWEELRALVAQAKGRPERLGAERVRRLGVLYRGTAADLAVARRQFPEGPTVPGLEDLVARAHAAVYGSTVRRESVAAFVTRGYWRRVAERPVLLLVAAALLLVPMAGTAVWAHADPGAAGGLLPGTTRSVASPRQKGTDLGLSKGERTQLAATIFTNNIRVSFAAVAGGITAGLITAGVLVFNGVILGVVAGLGVGAGNGRALTQLVVPHGVLELSCIVVAGAAGLRMGWALVDPGRRPRTQALAAEARAAVEVVLGTALWLVVAGFTEGLVTPLGIGVGPALVVGLGWGTVFWGLVWWRGRAAPASASETGPTLGPEVGRHAGGAEAVGGGLHHLGAGPGQPG
jgi:uncharacterized membrane protein SpoIIM required for sporulation